MIRLFFSKFTKISLKIHSLCILNVRFYSFVSFIYLFSFIFCIKKTPFDLFFITKNSYGQEIKTKNFQENRLYLEIIVCVKSKEIPKASRKVIILTNWSWIGRTFFKCALRPFRSSEIHGVGSGNRRPDRVELNFGSQSMSF